MSRSEDLDLDQWISDTSEVLAIRNRGSVDRYRSTPAGKGIRQSMIEGKRYEKENIFTDESQSVRVQREQLERVIALMNECKGSEVEITIESSDSRPLFLELEEPGTNHKTEIMLAPTERRDDTDE